MAGSIYDRDELSGILDYDYSLKATLHRETFPQTPLTLCMKIRKHVQKVLIIFYNM